ncbi:transposase [Sulfobacillus thermosulfidooxidans]
MYSLRLHIVFVTKYRRKTLTSELLDRPCERRSQKS